MSSRGLNALGPQKICPVWRNLAVTWQPEGCAPQKGSVTPRPGLHFVLVRATSCLARGEWREHYRLASHPVSAGNVPCDLEHGCILSKPQLPYMFMRSNSDRQFPEWVPWHGNRYS